MPCAFVFAGHIAFRPFLEELARCPKIWSPGLDPFWTSKMGGFRGAFPGKPHTQVPSWPVVLLEEFHCGPLDRPPKPRKISASCALACVEKESGLKETCLSYLHCCCHVLQVLGVLDSVHV